MQWSAPRPQMRSTEWMPMSLGVANGKLYVATAKGKGTGGD